MNPLQPYWPRVGDRSRSFESSGRQLATAVRQENIAQQPVAISCHISVVIISPGQWDWHITSEFAVQTFIAMSKAIN